VNSLFIATVTPEEFHRISTLYYRGHTDAVLCVQFDKEKVVSGSKDTTIKVLLANMLCVSSMYAMAAN